VGAWLLGAGTTLPIYSNTFSKGGLALDWTTSAAPIVVNPYVYLSSAPSAVEINMLGQYQIQVECVNAALDFASEDGDDMFEYDITGFGNLIANGLPAPAGVDQLTYLSTPYGPGSGVSTLFVMLTVTIVDIPCTITFTPLSGTIVNPSFSWPGFTAVGTGACTTVIRVIRVY